MESVDEEGERVLSGMRIGGAEMAAERCGKERKQA